MRVSRNILHYTKVIGLLVVVATIWLTANRTSDPPRFASGKPKTTETYVNGRAEGTWIWWFENGKKMTEGNFGAGRRNGIWQTWYENGSKKSESMYIDDKLNGQYIEWHKNGKIKHSGSFKDDKREGLHQFYDTSGLLLGKRFFVNGISMPEN